MSERAVPDHRSGEVRAAVTAMPSPEAIMIQRREENFPVAMWLLGPRTRRHLLAIYGFARLVDDIGDESPGDRLALLDQIERELDAPEHPLMQAVARTLRECSLPRDPFLRLIEANRRDQFVKRYRSLDDLLGYCRLSAAPIGELVLHVLNAGTPERIALSDRICAGLQIVEHLQDVDEDRAHGRFYIGDFGDASAWARELLDEGAPLVSHVHGRARLAVAGFLAGGRTALAALEGRPRRYPRAYLQAVAGR